jgi:hypothetical protein
LKSSGLDSTVGLIIFNRPDETKTVFEAIRKARPKQLLVIADGPRHGVAGEDVRCAAAKEVITEVDWPCDVRTNYAENNLGCAERVISGLNWAFEIAEELIILEDDCLPNQSFFRFCQELLERYRNDGRVSMISGNSFIDALHPHYSYYFSQVHYIWGWATWRSKWQQYDRYLRTWPEARRDGILREILDEPRVVEYWTRIFDSMYEGTGPNTWDYQWHYTSIMNNWLSVVPNRNLVSNIGFGSLATHTVDKYAFLAGMPTAELSYPLAHPPYVLPLRSSDRRTHREVFVPPFRKRLKRRLNKARAILCGE